MEEPAAIRYVLKGPSGQSVFVDFERRPRSRYEIYAAVRAAFERQVGPLGESRMLNVVIEGSALFGKAEAAAADRGFREGSGASHLPPADELEAARAEGCFGRFHVATAIHIVVQANRPGGHPA
jgi:hypothetical protein